MRMRSIQPGDRVRGNKRGRVFDARVLGAAPTGGLSVEPLDRGISWRQATAREVIGHWPHGPAGDDERAADGQLRPRRGGGRLSAYGEPPIPGHRARSR
jgi:hypothetical protein